MTDATLSLIPVTDLRIGRQGVVGPAREYIASLQSAESRRTMRSSIERAARILLGVDGQEPQAIVDIDTIPWGEVRYRHVEAVKAHLIEVEAAPATANKILVGLRQVLRRARKQRLMSAEDYEDAVDVNLLKESRLPEGRELSLDELRNLFDVCADGTMLGRRDAAILTLMARGGLRRAEVVRADLADWSSGSRGRLLVRGKGRKQRYVWLKGEARTAVEDWLEARGVAGLGPGPLVTHLDGPQRLTMQAVYDIVQRRGVAAGIDLVERRVRGELKMCTALAPHDLRRTYATHLFRAGADALLVQRLLGHEKLDTSARYDQRRFDALESACELLTTPYRGPTR